MTITTDSILLVGAVLGAILTIKKAYNSFFAETTTAKNEVRIGKCEDNQRADYEHLKLLDRQVNALDERVSNIETNVNEGLDRSNEASRVIASFLSKTIVGVKTGTMTDNELIDEANKLNDFFIKK